MRFAYQALLLLSQFLLGVLHVFLPGEVKLKRMLVGRRSSLARLNQLPKKKKKRIWAHAASLGEFQMLLPLLQKLETDYQAEIHVSFFSPSGFENAENPNNWGFYYMQHDSRSRAFQFLNLLEPDLAIFAKYEFWLSHLFALNTKKIPFLYWNLLLREDHFLQKFWAGAWRKELNCALVLCCQNLKTQRIIQQILPKTPNIHTGDIRFLQTKELRAQASIFNEQETTLWNQKKNIVWGSSWEEELEVLLRVLPLQTTDYRFILAPHDVSEKNLVAIEARIPHKTQRLSLWLKAPKEDAIVIVDGIGKLRFIYRYASLAVIGGGFKNALHNIIEPLSNGVPVLFGSNHKKFPEAQEAVDCKAALHAPNPKELSDILAFLLFHRGNLQMLAFHQKNAKAYFDQNTPNMEKVLPFCAQALTN